ncbi:LOB domain-containing protein 14 [Hibiscus syriacus]|uniref:LOB domain-containing protein 14 n=1 Tax=Hibiscus syriacus TaxID=106335 RepID=A0A6A2Y9N0_HIBSY|nr:LOB domain-containing protein 29-like [Hibiscus syriacus]KAE8666984.1 LOB domain-containing protein 14 [Hibiscus syriacus]
MTGSSSPCGACKFLRRKCVRGCVFAPYFCHEQGATHFAAIHKVFGASNVSKLLAQLPLNDRFEAALTISYEAQARVQDPIYGCVSHIFALQQQVFNLQAQLASLKELQAAQSSVTENPNDRYHGKLHNLQDFQSWFQTDSTPNFDPNSYGLVLDPTSSLRNFENSGSSSGSEDCVSFTTTFGMQTSNRQWNNCQDVAVDDLQAMAFGYAQHS